MISAPEFRVTESEIQNRRGLTLARIVVSDVVEILSTILIFRNNYRDLSECLFNDLNLIVCVFCTSAKKNCPFAIKQKLSE